MHFARIDHEVTTATTCRSLGACIAAATAGVEYRLLGAHVDPSELSLVTFTND